MSPSLCSPNTKESPRDTQYRARGWAGFSKGVEAMDSAIRPQMIYKFNGIYINFNHWEKLRKRCPYWSTKQKNMRPVPSLRRKCRWWWPTRSREERLSWSLGKLRKIVVFSLQWEALICTLASSPMIRYLSSRPAHSSTSPKTLRTTNKNMGRIVRTSSPWIHFDPMSPYIIRIKIFISFSLSSQYFIILLLLRIAAAKVKSVNACTLFVIG